MSSQSNVDVVCGPLAEGWPQGAPYDVVVLDGATDVVPHALCQQLKDGGRLVCVLGSGPGSKAMLYRRSGEEAGGRPVFDASAATAPGLRQNARFCVLILPPTSYVAKMLQVAAFSVGGDRRRVSSTRGSAYGSRLIWRARLVPIAGRAVAGF